jgi:hypothetical protein
MAEENVAPSHGRCPHCLLSCQNIAAGNVAPRDPLGRSLPFPPAFKAQKMAEAAAKAAGGTQRRGLPAGPRERQARPAASPRADPGRDW